MTAVNARGYFKFDADGLLKTALGAVRSPRAPRIACGILLIGLAASTVNDGVALYRAATAAGMTDLKGVKISPTSGRSYFSSDSLRALASAHLFGFDASTLAAGNAPAPRDTSLVLTGTLATANPSRGFALIGTRKDQALAHPVGDVVASGVVLWAVYPNRVIVKRAGLFATVFLPHGANAGGPALMSEGASASEARRATASEVLTGILRGPRCARAPQDDVGIEKQWRKTRSIRTRLPPNGA